MKHLKKAAIFAAMLAPLAMIACPSVDDAIGQFDLNIDVNKMVDTAKNIGEAAKPWKYSDERATGRVLAARVAASLGGVWRGTPCAEAWTKYVNKIGRGMALYSERPDIKYRFAILDSDDVNAYACPGGYIFVTRGLLKDVADEAQLAGVLAHEIGHVACRHIEKEIKKQKLTGAAMDIGLIVAESRGEITSEQSNVIKMVSGAGYDVLVKTGYAKADEYEADAKATKNLYKMGYNPKAIRLFIKTLEEQEKEKGAKLKILLSTHPAPSKRKDKLKDYLDKEGWDVEGMPNNAERFNAMKSKHPLP